MFTTPNRFFLRIAGIDPAVLVRCNTTEQLRYFAIAWTLFAILPLEVLISWGHLLWRAGSPPLFLILITSGALLVSFVGERAAIVSMAGGRTGPAVWMRFTLIVAVAFIATLSFLLHWYERDILARSLDAQTSFVNAREDKVSARLGLGDLAHAEKEALLAQKASVRALTELPDSIRSRLDQVSACTQELDRIRIAVSLALAPVRATLSEVNAELRQIKSQPDFAANSAYGLLANQQSKLGSQVRSIEQPRRSKEHECSVMTKEAVAARKNYQEDARREKTAADQHLAEQRALIAKTRAEFAPISGKIRQVAAKINDGTVNAQIKALGDLLGTDTLARIFAAGTFGLLILISGFAVWLKLGCKGGAYDQMVLADDAQADSDRQTELALHLQGNALRLQTELELLHQVAPIARQQRLGSEIVLASLQRHAERMMDFNQLLKSLPHNVARNWRATFEAGLAADQAVTIRWLEDYFQATGRPLPADWPSGISPGSKPAPVSSDKHEPAESMKICV